jgi:hypothetical protein
MPSYIIKVLGSSRYILKRIIGLKSRRLSSIIKVLGSSRYILKRIIGLKSPRLSSKSIIIHYSQSPFHFEGGVVSRVHVVAQFVEALCYKPEGCDFES